MAIFLSYRREDSLAIVGRIDDYLRAEFGDDGVYRDLEDIPPGTDFVDHLEQALSNCDVLVAIIGPRWRVDRLQNEGDFVRGEIEAALRRNIPTIPVLVEGAQLPAAKDLPAGMQPLVRRQSVEVEAGSDFKSDVARLVAGIHKLRGRSLPAERAERSTPGRRSLEPLVKAGSSVSPRPSRLPWLALGLVPLSAGGVWLVASGKPAAEGASAASAAAVSAAASPSTNGAAPPASASAATALASASAPKQRRVLSTPVSISFQNGVSPTPAYGGSSDATLKQALPSKNFGNEMTLEADGDDGKGVDKSFLLQWSVSDIPAGSEIKSAIIGLKINNASIQAYDAYALLRPWDATQVTWQQATSASPWASPGALDASDRGPLLGTLSGGVGSAAIPLNSAGVALIQSWVDGGTNAGIIIANSTNTDGADIASNESAAAASRPKLTVSYLPPDPASGT
ncbi:MAG TPA: DNRLRE domain-containing protein [Polyangiaceae bacterium]|nr:DNRLRE domain-containing protein [Polyangiaceae bacterium]